MATTVVRQFVGTIRVGTTVRWRLGPVTGPFNRAASQGAKPEMILYWQAVPLFSSIAIDSPRIATARAGLIVGPITVVQEADTSLTHVVPITCIDEGNPPGTSARFVTTYALYYVKFDVP